MTVFRHLRWPQWQSGVRDETSWTEWNTTGSNLSRSERISTFTVCSNNRQRLCGSQCSLCFRVLFSNRSFEHTHTHTFKCYFSRKSRLLTSVCVGGRWRGYIWGRWRRRWSRVRKMCFSNFKRPCLRFKSFSGVYGGLAVSRSSNGKKKRIFSRFSPPHHHHHHHHHPHH